MAAASTIISAVALAAGTGLKISQAAKAAKARKSAQSKLNNYNRQRLGNVASGLSVPTEGFEMEKEQLQQSQAEAAYQLSQTGAQGAIGGAQALTSGAQRSMADISNRFAQKEMEFKRLLATEEARRQQMMERREEQDLAGLGAEIAYNRSAQQAGVQGAVSGVASAAELAGSLRSGNVNPTPTGGNNMTPMDSIYKTPQVSNNYTLPSTNNLAQ